MKLTDKQKAAFDKLKAMQARGFVVTPAADFTEGFIATGVHVDALLKMRALGLISFRQAYRGGKVTPDLKVLAPRAEPTVDDILGSWSRL